MRLRLRRSWEWPGRDAWPLLLLLLAVLVPTGFLLWFMSDAITQQSDVSRHMALESTRGQLRLLRARLDLLWRSHADRLGHERPSGAEQPGPPTVEQRFAQLLLKGGFDGAIVFDGDGRAVFPRIDQFSRGGAADLQLLSLHRLRPGDPSRSTHITRLASLVNDYGVPMSSAQRLFVMGELRRMAPEVGIPTETALRLSTQVLEGGITPPEPGGLRQTFMRDIWALASADRRVVGLYRTRTLQALIDDALQQVAPPGIRFVAYAPDAGGDYEAIAAGSSLPGWQISFVTIPNASQLDAATRGRLLTYLWVGFAGIAIMAVLGVIAGQTFGRQLRLARMKTDLTAAVSHELRAPLASVRVLVDGLLGDTELDPVKTREYLQLIAGEHARLSRVIENFLTFSRLERARAQFVLAPADPSAIVAASVDAIRERTPAGCDLRVEVPHDLPPVMADADALGTALINLLDNALKFTPHDKCILVSAYADDRSVMFAVRDNGAGIPAREQRRIFKRFYRVDQRLARETAGVGLGLSIVALIARAHGGQVEVSSQPGAGSTFTLRVPLASGGRA
jgi:signal transduction histidine kinase